MSKHWKQQSGGGIRWNPEKAVCYPYQGQVEKWFRSPEMWGNYGKV